MKLNKNKIFWSYKHQCFQVFTSSILICTFFTLSKIIFWKFLLKTNLSLSALLRSYYCMSRSGIPQPNSYGQNYCNDPNQIGQFGWCGGAPFSSGGWVCALPFPISPTAIPTLLPTLPTVAHPGFLFLLLKLCLFFQLSIITVLPLLEQPLVAVHYKRWFLHILKIFSLIVIAHIINIRYWALNNHYGLKCSSGHDCQWSILDFMEGKCLPNFLHPWSKCSRS